MTKASTKQPFLPYDRLLSAARIFESVFDRARLAVEKMDIASTDPQTEARFDIVYPDEIIHPAATPKLYNQIIKWLVDYCSQQEGTNESSLRRLVDHDTHILAETTTTWIISIVQRGDIAVDGIASRGVSLIRKKIQEEDFLANFLVAITNTKSGATVRIPLKFFRLHEIVYSNTALAKHMKSVTSAVRDLSTTTKGRPFLNHTKGLTYKRTIPGE